MAEATSRPQAQAKPFRVLMVTGAYPTERVPHWGTFIKSQVDSLVAAGIEVEVVHPKPGPMPLRYASAVLQVLRASFGGGRFDVVHGHYGLWCLVARLQWTRPVVASFLGDDLLGTPLASGGYSKKDALVVHISQWLSQHVDAVIVKSEQMKQVIPKSKVFVIPNGVDFALFRPIPREQARETLGWDQSRRYVLFGNDPNIPRKGYSLAQDAIERLHARGIPAELVVANGLPQTTLVQYINACHALLLTSIHEGSPNVVKEAMACNIPVVSTDVGDVAQVIRQTAGCSVCSRDPAVLADALARAFEFSGPTTGREDIRHLDRTLVAGHVIAVYETAAQRQVADTRKAFSLLPGG
ncbi:MAG TPA: glycosyltransferase [Ktedonobacterales bacterium]|jgi:glycosyltransferase involved in cell wall biosynthesis|nr:glycosyltransferase [Ktedonobacterales bacterium]